MNEASIKRAALRVAVLASFMVPFVSSAVNIAIPSIGKEFGSDPVALGWISTSYVLASVAILLPVGRLADIYGRRMMLKYGILIHTLASALCMVAGSTSQLVTFRCLQGLGGAMFFGPCVAIVASVFPEGKRGKALGITAASVYLGIALGPSIGGLMTKYLGWRSIFGANIIFGAIIVLLVYATLKGEWSDAAGERFDLGGSLLYCAALVATIFGFSHLVEPFGAPFFAAGLLCLAVFVALEARSKNPMLNITLFTRNRTFAFSNAAALINYSATAATAFLVSIYLQDIKGLDPGQAGLVMLVQAGLQTLCSPLAGRLSDRIEPRVLSSIGMALTTVGLVVLSLLRGSSSLAHVISALALLGLGFGFFSSPNTNAVMSSVEKRYYGIASSMLGTARMVGMLSSMSAVMLLLNAYMGRVQMSPDNYPAFLAAVRVAFSIFAVLCGLGIFASLARGRLHNNR